MAPPGRGRLCRAISTVSVASTASSIASSGGYIASRLLAIDLDNEAGPLVNAKLRPCSCC